MYKGDKGDLDQLRQRSNMHHKDHTPKGDTVGRGATAQKVIKVITPRGDTTQFAKIF